MSPLQSRKGQRTPTIRATLSCITQFIFSPSRYTIWFQNLNTETCILNLYLWEPSGPVQQRHSSSFGSAAHHRHRLYLATPLTVCSQSNHGLEFRHQEITGPEI